MPKWIPLAALSLICVTVAGCGGSSAKPAAKVNGNQISMAAYNSAVWQVRVEQIDKTGYDYCGTKGMAPECRVLERQALTGLIDRELVREYAQAHHISISPADSQRNWNLVFYGKYKGNQAALNGTLKRLRITEAQFKASLNDDLLQQRVEAAVTAGMPLSVPMQRIATMLFTSRKQVQPFLAQLHGGRRFLQLVTYQAVNPKSPCAHPKACGDLGWIPVGFIPPSVSALRTASPGSVVGPYHFAGTYYLYFVEAHAASRPLTAAQTVTARQQVFTAWLARQEKHANVMRYVAA